MSSLIRLISPFPRGCIVLIDTTVFCNIVKVPGRNQNEATVADRLTRLVKVRTSILLPIAAIIETGNHVGQLADGGLRRQAAARFVKQVRGALNGEAPWLATRLAELDDWNLLLDGFPNAASKGLGFGDVTITAEYHYQKKLHPKRDVYIWSLDSHLAAYGPEHWP